jgi:dipeptidyl-peptidase 4
LYTYNFSTQQEKQLTTDGNFTTLNGFASWVYWEEIFGRATAFRAFWWSPDGKKLAFMHFDESMVPMFPIYRSDGQHGSIEETRYPKVGDKNPEVKLGFISPEGGTTTWADFNHKHDQYFGWPKWVSNETLSINWLNRGQDTLILYNVNAANGNKTQIYTETQKTWIDLSQADGGLEFINNFKQFIYQSDKTGWNQLYLYNADGSLINKITDGKFTVKEVLAIDEKNKTVYFTARGIENTARYDVYKASFDGKKFTRLSDGVKHFTNVKMSPDNKYFLATCSNTNTPAALVLYDTKGKLIKEIANAKGSEMDNYSRAKTELIYIKSDDGLYDLPAMVIWPVNMDPNKKYPMLISIYGGPDAGTVYDSWNFSANKQWYAQEGLIQVAFDHRASGHFGKEGVNYMHRELGKWELIDYSTMAKWFINKGYADPTKICITGFSYGGYMTCLALTKGADVFTHGMAGGSVIDYALYDTHYTERFMDNLNENMDGYKATNVLTYVDKYKGKLQLVHGTMDDNVHMQNTIQFASALQDKKKDFEFMLYPNGRHGWGNLPGKSDHYDNLKTTFIYRHLLEKPVPEGLLK